MSQYWEIDKAFDFCYGHRVWSQKLEEGYACTRHCKCKHLHGHQGLVRVHLTAPELQAGMVTDFNHLNWLKKFIDDNIDHKFIIDSHDPLFTSMVDMELKLPDGRERLSRNDTVMIDALREYQNSFYVVDFVPTSENLAKWMFDLVQEKMAPLGVSVVKVEWFETPKSRSVYVKE